ncbi:MAG: hypothetical protein ABII12_12835 [Planctomycetota bacterium]
MTEGTAKPYDPKFGIQWFVFLDGFLRLFIWYSSIALSVALFTVCDAWPKPSIINADLSTAWLWGQKLSHLVFLFNIFYIAHLLVFRLIIPTPRAGRYEIGPGKRPSRQLVYSAFLAALTKARYQAPFPGFLVFHLVSLPPLKWIMNPIFGPKSKSSYIAEPCIIDPYNVTIGRNVIIGFGSTIAGHYQERDAVFLAKTIIEDDVLIGGHSAIAGSHIKRGAIIGAGSMVLAGCVVGEYEYWSGNPARRRRVFKPKEPASTGQDPQPDDSVDAAP